MPIRTTMTTVAGDAGSPPGLSILMCWLSPAYPVGAYAYSHGLEWAVEAGDVGDETSLEAWLGSILLDGAGRNDAILLCATHRATGAFDRAMLGDVNELALALAPSTELRLETAQQGRSFLDATLAAWPHPALAEAVSGVGEIAYPVAVGTAAACHGVALQDVARAYLTAFAGNLVSAAIRLAPIGQTSGQRVLARLAPRLTQLADEALTLDLDDLGGSTFRADLGSFRHETQYTRLFRS